MSNNSKKKKTTIDDLLARIAFWIAWVVFGLVVGLSLFVIIRITPALYRAAVRTTHKLLISLEAGTQRIPRIAARVFHSIGRTVTVSTVLWTTASTPLALLLFIAAEGPNPGTGVLVLVATLVAAACLGASAGWTISQERAMHKRTKKKKQD